MEAGLLTVIFAWAVYNLIKYGERAEKLESAHKLLLGFTVQQVQANFSHYGPLIEQRFNVLSKEMLRAEVDHAEAFLKNESGEEITRLNTELQQKTARRLLLWKVIRQYYPDSSAY